MSKHKLVGMSWDGATSTFGGAFVWPANRETWTFRRAIPRRACYGWRPG